MGFSYFPGGLRGCIWNVFAKVEFKCLFATAIDRLRLSRTGIGRWLSRWGSRQTLRRLLASVREVFWG